MNAYACDFGPPPDVAAVPCNVEAEQALLGVLLYEANALDEVGPLSALQFYEPLHGRLFDLLAAQIRSGRAVDPALIAGRLTADLGFTELGGVRYLANLLDNAPPASSARDYAYAVADTALRREMLAEAKTLGEAAISDTAQDAADVLAQAERRLGELAERGSQTHRLLSGSDAIEDALDHVARFAERPEFPTGLIDLDWMLGGLRRGKPALPV